MPANKVPVRDANNTVFQVVTRTDSGQGTELQLAGMDPGAQADGHSVTVGATTDTAWAGSGPSTVMGLLKAIALFLGGTVKGSNAAASQVDGHSTTLGATTDAAVVTSATGSLSGKLRGLVAILADVWDSTNHQLRIVGGPTQYPEDQAHVSGDLGMLFLGVRQDAAGSLSSNTGDYTPLQLDDQGQLRVAPGQLIAASAAVTRVAASATSAQVLAANTQRTGAKFMNDSAAICYLLEGTGTASPTNFSVKLAPNDTNGIGGYYETPFGFSGAVQAVWSAAAGGLAVTETS
jgi:hypothetical protein